MKKKQLNRIEDKLDWMINEMLSEGSRTVNPDPPKPRKKKKNDGD
jgi:hypothetical protein|tara:strand:+ start:1497 stop:1631 length:135 start_codon:yes stop_codon:yes gene_type:complete